MRGVLLVAALCALAVAADVQAVVGFGGALENVSQCCAQNPTWFSLWHTFAVNSTRDRALAVVNAQGITTWQQSVTPQVEPAVFGLFKSQALVGKGPNLLLASSNGLLDLAKCGVLAPWTFDAPLLAALPASVVQLVTWRGTRWALPVAQETNVLFVNTALFPGVVPDTLAAFVTQATNCSTRMVYQRDLADVSGFYLGTELFASGGSVCTATPTIQNVFALLNQLAAAPCTVTVSRAAGGGANANDFANGLAAFTNGVASDLGRYEAALGARLAVVALPKAAAGRDTRSWLGATVIYANAHNRRQSGADWANYAASRGQAGTWQNTGRVTVARTGVPLPPLPADAQRSAALNVIAASAWPLPVTEYWAGLDGFAGYTRAFAPVANLVGRAGVTDAQMRAAAVSACDCMNNAVCTL